MSDKILVDHDSAVPTRKVGASSAAAGLVGALVGALVGILPGSGSEELRDAITVLLDAVVGGGLTGLTTLIAGYFVRDAVTVEFSEPLIGEPLPDDANAEKREP